MHRRCVWGLLALAAAGLWMTRAEAGEAKKPVRALFLTESRGFRHGSVTRKNDELAPAEVAMKQLGQQTGLFTLDATQNCEADFTKENLQNYDLVMFYTTGVLPISDETRTYFTEEWLKQKGHGWIGFHSATDTYRTNDPKHAWYWDISGGTFNGHPWGAGTTVTISVHDPQHPAMKPFGTEFQIQDEIYQYSNWKPENVRVLMSLNMAKCNPKKPYHVPVAWCREWGGGKIFYTNLGHRNETWTDPRFVASTEAAVRWILGEVEADATPNPDVSQAQEEKARKDAGE